MKVQDVMKEFQELEVVEIWLKYVELKKDIPKDDYSKMANYSPNRIVEQLIDKRRVQMYNAEVKFD